jgi:glycine cleavage system H protein
MKVQNYNLPEDLHYEPNHFWVRREGDIAVMGMDDFAQSMAGEVVYVQLPDEGKMLKAGGKFAKIESGKWLGKVYAPLSGELVGVNDALESNPGLINEDCYGKGWLYKIKADDWSELDNLVHGAEAIEKWILEEIKKYAQE